MYLKNQELAVCLLCASFKINKFMIAIKSIRLLHLISYLLVTSQVLFYLFILSDALKAVSLENYFEQRKIIDSLMITRFKAMYYSCLALSIVAVIVSVRQPASLFFVSSAIALILLSIDLAITVKGSLPLNALSHSYGAATDNVNWQEVRIQWLSYMKYRGIAMTMGMISLFAGLVFGKN
jgi:uncharacterized membrane protein